MFCYLILGCKTDEYEPRGPGILRRMWAKGLGLIAILGAIGAANHFLGHVWGEILKGAAGGAFVGIAWGIVRLIRRA